MSRISILDRIRHAEARGESTLNLSMSGDRVIELAGKWELDLASVPMSSFTSSICAYFRVTPTDPKSGKARTISELLESGKPVSLAFRISTIHDLCPILGINPEIHGTSDLVEAIYDQIVFEKQERVAVNRDSTFNDSKAQKVVRKSKDRKKTRKKKSTRKIQDSPPSIPLNFILQAPTYPVRTRHKAKSKSSSQIWSEIFGSSIAGLLFFLVMWGSWKFAEAGGWGYIFGHDTSPSIAVSPPPQTISKPDRIDNGMSYSEVCRILGSQGQKEQLIDKSNQQSSYNWVTSQGIVRARFENGRLVEKVQFGTK